MAKFVDIQSRAKEITEQQGGKLDKNREVNSHKGRIVCLWAGAKRRRTRSASDELAQELKALQRSTWRGNIKNDLSSRIVEESKT